MSCLKCQLTLRETLFIVMLFCVGLGWLSERRYRHQYDQSMNASKLELIEAHDQLNTRLKTLMNANSQLQTRIREQSTSAASSQLHVADTTKFYLRETPVSAKGVWRLQAYLPPERVFKIVVNARDGSTQDTLAATLTGYATLDILVTPRSVRLMTATDEWFFRMPKSVFPPREDPAVEAVIPVAAPGDALRYEQREQAAEGIIDLLKLVDPKTPDEAPLLELLLEAVEGSAGGVLP